jgi:hypothetical protein
MTTSASAARRDRGRLGRAVLKQQGVRAAFPEAHGAGFVLICRVLAYPAAVDTPS